MFIKKRERAFEYYFQQLSTIPNIKQFRVFNMFENSFVGTLDEEFIAVHGEPGTTFIVKGQPWKIVTVDGDKVMVEPVEDMEAAVPGWEGELIPVLSDVTQEVGSLRRLISQKLGKESAKTIMKRVQEKYPVDDSSAEEMVEVIKKQKEFGVVPDDKTVLIEDMDNMVVIHTCAGNTVNETLGRFIVSLLTSRIGSVGFKTDPYRIMIEFQQKNIELLKEILFNTKPEYLKSYLELSLGNSELFAWKFVHVAKRFGAITRDADFGKVRMKKVIEDYADTPIYRETMKELLTEKFDVKRAVEMLRRMQKKEINVVFKNGMSPLGNIGLKHKYGEVVGPAKPEMEIFELFKQRLMNTQTRMVCVNCGDWEQVYFVKDVSDNLKCSKCDSKLLASLNKEWVGAGKIVKKALRKSGLMEEDEKRYENMRTRADLFMYHKSKAVQALAGKGVGAATAKRILARYHKDDGMFLRDILEAEKQFARTKRFWAV